MTAVYEWVRNITYYMIFITVVGNLLADSKYEKYLRFFAGIILILLVLKPLTGEPAAGRADRIPVWSPSPFRRRPTISRRSCGAWRTSACSGS